MLMQACMLTIVLTYYFLACTGPYLGQIGSYQGDQGIYGIRIICRTSLITKSDQNTQAGMHACYGLACTGTYLSQMGWYLAVKYQLFVSKFLPVTIDKSKNKWAIQKTQKTLNNPKWHHEIMTVLNLSSFCWVQLNLLDKLHVQNQTHYQKDVSSRAGDILKTYLISVKKYYTARQTDI